MPERGRERGFNDYENERPRGARRRDEEREERWRERDEYRGEGGRQRRMSEDNGDAERGGQRSRRNGMDRAARLPLAAASTIGETYVAALGRSASLIGNNIRLWQGETMRFMSERLERDAEIIEELGEAKNLMDFFAIHQRWLNDVAAAYSQEFMRLSKLTARAAEEGMTAGRSIGRKMGEAGEQFSDEFREGSRAINEERQLQ